MIEVRRTTWLGSLVGGAFDRTGSDKHHSHNYGEAYAAALSILGEPRRFSVLEIGSSNGGPESSSAPAWLDIGASEVWTADRDPSKDPSVPGVRFAPCDQSSEQSLQALAQSCGDGRFDIIVDDACHDFGPSSMSWRVLSRCLRRGGVYAVEDVRKCAFEGQHTASQWAELLSEEGWSHAVLDCRPERRCDDSAVVLAWLPSERDADIMRKLGGLS